MGTLRDIKRKASQEAKQIRKAEEKQELLATITVLRNKYAESPNFLAKICRDLNDNGVKTLQGRLWNSRSLWAFIDQNTAVSDEVPKIPVKHSMRNGLREMLDLSLRVAEWAAWLNAAADPETPGELVQEILDADLMALVDKKMELDRFRSRGDLLDFLLRQYVAGSGKA